MPRILLSHKAGTVSLHLNLIKVEALVPEKHASTYLPRLPRRRTRGDI
jgi:hypothetical protein